MPKLRKLSSGTGGSVTLPVSVANGGTGATTSSGARDNLGVGEPDSPSFSGLTIIPSGSTGPSVVISESGGAYSQIYTGDYAIATPIGSSGSLTLGADSYIDITANSGNIGLTAGGNIVLGAGTTGVVSLIADGTFLYKLWADGGVYAIINSSGVNTSDKTFSLPNSGGTFVVSSAPTAGQLLIGSTGSATGFALNTLTGTANQITVSNSSGSITLSTPQSIGTGSDPVFNTVTGSSGIVGGTGNTAYKTKIMQIGDWNMDSTATITVAHGLTAANIRTVLASITNDSSNSWWPVTQMYTGTVTNQVQITSWDATNINLARLTGGDFDNTSFDSTSFNRGFILIHYI